MKLYVTFALVWATCGLPGMIWFPRAHVTWTRPALVVLWLIGVFICVVGGPMALLRSYMTRNDCRPWWWERTPQ